MNSLQSTKRSILRDLLSSLLAAMERLKAHPALRSPTARRAILLLALAVFTIGLVLAIHNDPKLIQNLRWQPVLALVLIGVPLTILLNTWEYLLSARLVSRRIAPTRALEITVIGSAANMLPIPGSTLVRIAGLKAAGAGYREGTLVTLLVAGVWIGVAFFYAGVAIAFYRFGLLSALFMALGLGGLGVTWVLASGMSGSSRAYLGILVVKTALVLTDALRMYWCLKAVDLDAGFAQASGLVVASVMGSAVSIVPAGLGVREVVSAALAPFLGISAAAGFVAVSLNRILGLATLLPVAVVLLRSSKYRKSSTEPISANRA